MLGLIAIIAIIAQVLPIEIILLLAPIVVYAVTFVVRWALPKIPGWAIVSVVVPVLSAIVAWVATMINPEASFLLQVILGLLAVFVNELIKQFQQLKG